MKDLKLNEQEIAINSLLAANNIEFNVVTIGELLKKDDWEHDLYSISFRSSNFKDKVFTQEFRQGTGHRMASQFTPVKKPATHKPVRIASKKYNSKSMGVKNSYGMIEYPNQYLILPTAASVLHSCLLDAQCGNETFEDFCANLGYDEDSRKALELYLACQATNKELRKVFSPDLITKIEVILQDY